MATKNKNKKTEASFEDFDAPATFDSDFTIDFTAMPDEIEYTIIPNGVYDGIVSNVAYGESRSSGNPMLTWTVTVEYEGEELKQFSHTVLAGNPNATVRTKKTIQNLLPHAPGKEHFNAEAFDPKRAGEIFIGTPCRVKLSIDSYQGRQRNRVDEILPPSASADDFLS